MVPVSQILSPRQQRGYCKTRNEEIKNNHDDEDDNEKVCTTYLEKINVDKERKFKARSYRMYP